jgi:hypothetical protein
MHIYDTTAEKISLAIQDLKKIHVLGKKKKGGGGIHYPYPKYLCDIDYRWHF